MPLLTSGPIITQPNSLLVVKFDYIKSYLEFQYRIFEILLHHNHVASPFSMNNGVDATFSRNIGVKIGRSTSKWHNFYIHNSIGVLISLLEIYLCV